MIEIYSANRTKYKIKSKYLLSKWVEFELQVYERILERRRNFNADVPEISTSLNALIDLNEKSFITDDITVELDVKIFPFIVMFNQKYQPESWDILSNKINQLVEYDNLAKNINITSSYITRAENNFAGFLRKVGALPEPSGANNYVTKKEIKEIESNILNENRKIYERISTQIENTTKSVALDNDTRGAVEHWESYANRREGPAKWWRILYLASICIQSIIILILIPFILKNIPNILNIDWHFIASNDFSLTVQLALSSIIFLPVFLLFWLLRALARIERRINYEKETAEIRAKLMQTFLALLRATPAEMPPEIYSTVLKELFAPIDDRPSPRNRPSTAQSLKELHAELDSLAGDVRRYITPSEPLP